MSWQPIQRIAYAVATFPFKAEQPADLPLQVGDELYIIEKKGDWYRGYLQAAPSLLAGLTSSTGQVLEARIFTGIFPQACVEVRELLGEEDSDSLREQLGEHMYRADGRTDYSEQDENIDPLEVDNLAVKPPQKPKKQRSVNGNGDMRKSKGKKRTSLAVIPLGAREPNTPKPPAPVPMLKIGDETPTSASEPLVDEIASCLREWHDKNFHELLLSRQYPTLDSMNNMMQSLDGARRQILHKVLTKHEMNRLREQVVWDLVRGNKAFNGEVIVRDPTKQGRLLTGDDSAVEVTRLQSMMSLLDEPPQVPGAEKLALHHLLLSVKSFVGATTELTTLVFFLAAKVPGEAAKALSESYVVEAPASGNLTDLAKQNHMKTVFADLVSSNFGDDLWPNNDLYLVVKVISGQQILSGKPDSRAGKEHSLRHQPSVMGSIGGSIGRAGGRRSLMWGKGSQQNTFSKNSNKLNPLSEAAEQLVQSKDGPPNTADGVKSISGSEQKSISSNGTIQRTVGIGALKISSVLKQDQETEHMIPIWAPISHASGEYEHPEEGWDEVIKDLFGSNSRQTQFEKSRRAERLQIHLKPFVAPDVEDLIKETPTLLSGVVPTYKMGFAGAPTKPRSDIYLTIDEAFLPRQALLCRANGGATTLPNHLSCDNLQITLEIRNSRGQRLDNVIYYTSQAKIGQSTWQSAATTRGDSWRQTLKLVIAAVDVPGSHVVLTLTDCPGAPFAISYIPLWDQHAFIRDGHHSLNLYKYDEATRYPLGGGQVSGGYLSLPWNARGKDDVSKDVEITGPISTLRVQTYLCSTRLTQDKDLLGLLKWREYKPAQVQDLLKRLVFVPEIEIVKLLPDVFNAIFGILTEQLGNDDYEDLTFTSLVTVLGIVHDRRFNLQPLVDHYAETQFNYPFACSCLVRAFTRLLSNPADPETSRKLRATFKVVRHILKFISAARGQQVEKEAGIGITNGSPGFTKQLGAIFKSLEGLMRASAPILVGSQTLAVQHFHTWIPELVGLLSTEEIVHIAIDFMDSCASAQGKLILYKLVLIINYSKLDLFSQPEQRQALCMNTVRWIAPHWGKTDDFNEQWRDQIRLCCTILSTQVQNLANEIPDHIPKIIDSYLGLLRLPKPEHPRLSLLFPTTYPFPSKPIAGNDAKFDEALVELSAILSAISNLPAGMQLELAEEDMATLIDDILHVHLSILECDAFPANWLSVHIYHHKSTMKTLEYLASILVESFLPDPDNAEDYNTELWKAFFVVLVKLVGSDSLALETFTEQKRRAVWKIAGDIREDGAALLEQTWYASGWETTADERQQYNLARVGGYQVQYIPGLVGPIIELCLSVHLGLRRVAVQVLQSFIVSEFTLNQSIDVIETEIVECLAHLFKTKPLTESVLEKLFIVELLELFDHLADIEDDPLYAAIQQSFQTIDKYLDLLVAVYGSNTSGEASRIHNRLQLMAFFRDYQKDAIYVTYVHDLEKEHIAQRELTQAGLALRLHADMYDWHNEAQLPALPQLDFPAQSQHDRKERLYFDLIKHFEDGQAWASALAAYKELELLYSNKTADLPKLARTERAMASIHEKIPKLDRIIPHYYRVIFRGLGFTVPQRNKEYVYEAGITEKLSAFMDRLLKEHPHAEFITSGDVADLDVEGQFLVISSLTPHRDLNHFVYQQARVPQPVRDFLLASNPSTFSVTTKRHSVGPVNEHYCEKAVYKTQKAFPALTRRTIIASVEQVRYGAVETGLERISRRTGEMMNAEKRFLNGEHNIARTIIDYISVAVNSTSDNSASRYRVLLPVNNDPEDPLSKPKWDRFETALHVALIDHVTVIKRCLAMFAKEEYSYHSSEIELENLSTQFEATYAPELLTPWAFPQPRASVPRTPMEVHQKRWSVNSARMSDPGDPKAESRRNSMIKLYTREMQKRDLAAQNTAPSLFAGKTNADNSNWVTDTMKSFTTVDTGILDGGRSRNRLSSLFGQGNGYSHNVGSTNGFGHERQQSEKEAILAPVVNLQHHNNGYTNGSNGGQGSISPSFPAIGSFSSGLSKSPSVSSTVRNFNPRTSSQVPPRGRQTSVAGQSMISNAASDATYDDPAAAGSAGTNGTGSGSNGKKRGSFFTSSLGRSGRGKSGFPLSEQQRQEEVEREARAAGEDSGWVTDLGESVSGKRSLSSRRESESEEGGKGSVGGSGGSGRKRLSLAGMGIKLGKKSSKGSALNVGTLEEE